MAPVTIGVGVRIGRIRRQAKTVQPIDAFKRAVLADGGIFLEDLFRAEFARAYPLIQNEAVGLIIPGAYKAGVIYAMNTLTGDPVPITFSRASTASYIDENGAVQIAASNIPRIDYSRGYPAYLLERSSTNINIESNGGWLGSFESNFLTRKGLTYQKFSGNSGLTRLSGAAYGLPQTGKATVSYFVSLLSGTGDFRLRLSTRTEGKPNAWVEYNILTETIVLPEGLAGSVSKQDLGDGFYRVEVVIDCDCIELAPLYSDSEFLVSSVQVEIGQFPTSLIQTSGSQVTRSRDQLVTGPIKGASETSVYMEAEVVHQVTPGNSFYFNSRGAGLNGTWWQRNTAVQIMSYNDGVIAQNEYYIENGVNKIATSIKYGGAWKLSANGSPVTSSPLGSTFGTQEEINVDVSTTIMHLRTFGVLHRQLTDQEHVELTQP